MQDRETRKIIVEQGQLYGLTEEQSLVMWDQYWMEHVIKRIFDKEYIMISMEALGTYFVKGRRTERAIKAIEKIGEKRELTLKDLDFKQRCENLLKKLEKWNENQKYKRIYG